MNDIHVWDLVLGVLFAILAGLFAMLAWFLRNKVSAYDKHLETCHAKDVEYGKTEMKLATMESRLEGSRITMHWVGDCLVTIGAKMDIPLPQRPEV